MPWTVSRAALAFSVTLPRFPPDPSPDGCDRAVEWRAVGFASSRSGGRPAGRERGTRISFATAIRAAAGARSPDLADGRSARPWHVCPEDSPGWPAYLRTPNPIMFPYQYLLAQHHEPSSGDGGMHLANARAARRSMRAPCARAAARRSPGRWLCDLLRGRQATSASATPAPAERQCVVDSGATTERATIRLEREIALVAGAYVTDGASLFRVEHMHSDRASGKTFIELEDCATMVLSICTRETLAALPLRSVAPTSRSQLAQASQLEDDVVGAGRAAAPR